MVKKGYSYYKDKGYKFPAIATIAGSFITYGALSAIGVALIGGTIYNGYTSYQEIIEVPENETPYMEVSAQKSDALRWSQNFVSNTPPNFTEWNINEGLTPKHTFDYSKCAGLGEVPITVVGTSVASGNSTTLTAQTYGAGQAEKYFNDYKEIYKECFTGLNEEENGKEVMFNNGFSFVMGDAIVSLYTEDKSRVTELKDYYIAQARKTLPEFNCINIDGNLEDYKRSFYYSPENYVGLQDSQNVETNVKLSELPSPVVPELSDFSTKETSKPESPLPSNFPELPESMIRPTIPSAPEKKDNFSEDAYYRIVDDEGPACGWEWSGQVMPEYDLNELDVEKVTSINSSQKNVDTQANAYLSTVNGWLGNTISVMPQVSQWNTYVEQVDSVRNSWQWLKDERNALKPSWDTYVANYNNWLTFDSRKAAASKEYDEKLRECVAKQEEVLEWENQWGEIYNQQRESLLENGSSSDENSDRQSDNFSFDENRNLIDTSPSDTPSISPSTKPSVNIPPRPEGCNVLPTKPAILSQQKPSEPLPPSVPAGVTIPDSWNRPNQLQ